MMNCLGGSKDPPFCSKYGTANPIQFITNYSQWFVMSFKTYLRESQNDKLKLNSCF
ncbi:hypothetical protein NTHI1209_01010 [Haemophilus influenzae]|uniref:Uncharacterized protein n=1 Tax=Haemophilus influenzae TaxID=727 RepID=A0A158SX10_HAEIF|nr:hypothetical protein NTHI1209_01010 [Haemophilus influenzae]